MSFFEPLLSYLDEPGTHLKSSEASRILVDLTQSAQTWQGERTPADGEVRAGITEPIELIEAMQLCAGALDTRLLDDLLIHTISQ